jgi:hypothetical protein
MLLHACNIVEHPELIAERLVRFAQRVGRDNIVAGTDCGFSSQASYRTEVHPTVVWEKFKALRAERRSIACRCRQVFPAISRSVDARRGARLRGNLLQRASLASSRAGREGRSQ